VANAIHEFRPDSTTRDVARGLPRPITCPRHLHHIDDLSGVGGEKRPGIVHRLDRGTSGLMVIAKHDRAHEELARQFHDREVEKEYVPSYGAR
jgi:23S rRNA-/tRNA-specific pseudouridylate synthase